MLRKFQLQTPSSNETHLKQLKHGSRETLSDSETGTLSDELHEFANSLGLNSPSELNEDRFRVNRAKMELLIQGSMDAYKDAEVFFQQVMEATNTLIGWPKRLKIGAKNKKDPHVRITGLPANVGEAKKLVTSVLDTPHTRVTLKMDVSYTTHSHIIGKGGQSVNRVMHQTHCHIHFPDSNRYPMTEKNNQVSISGEMPNVEKARAYIRNLVPLIFEFELSRIELEQNPLLKQIQENYGVLVTIRSQPKLNGTLISIKGSELQVARVKEATSLVMALFSGDNKGIMNVQMTMEISSQHHSAVMGPSGTNVRAIMAHTGTEIMFPDAGDPNIASLKRTTVKIRGNIHAVYLARQQLIGSLPLMIIFELDQKTEPNRDKIYQISQQQDVNITMRNIVKHNKIMVTIRGTEREASMIYEARKQLLELDESNVVANIPATYYMPVTELKSTSINNNTKRSTGLTDAEISTGINNLNSALPFHQSNASQGCMLPPPSAFCSAMPKNVPFPVMQQGRNSSLFSFENGSYNVFPNSYSPLCFSADNGYYSLSSTTSTISSPNHSPRGHSPYEEQYNRDENQSSIEMTARQTRAQLEYEQWKLNAYQAMQAKPASTSVRNPTSIWSGQGFSQSSPGYVMKQAMSDKTMESNFLKSWKINNMTDKEITNFPSLKSSNYLERTPSWIQKSIASSNDLISLFISLGLESYIGLFASNEIDLDTFCLLNEKDLIELGVYAHGARCKMMTAIKELSMGTDRRSFDAAPGAERRRKGPTSTYTNFEVNP